MKIRILLILSITTLFQQCRQSTENKPLQENKIVLENRKDGTTEWMITVPEKHCEYPDHQYCRRPQVEGFCSKTSYTKDDTLKIFVSTDPASSFTLDIFR